MTDSLASFELQQNIGPLEAIEEAVKESIWIQTKTKLETPNFFYEDGKPPKSLKEAVTVGTTGMCEFGSENVLHSLASKANKLFNRMTLVSTNIISSDSPINYGLPKDDHNTHHTYFLIQDKNDVWYAGSPANHYLNKEKDYATTLIIGKDLEGVIRKMETRDKSSYPSADELQKQVGNMKVLPLPNDQVVIFDVRQTSNGIQTNTHKFPYHI